MLPKRLSVKFFATDESEIDLHRTFEVFQRWIQKQTVEGMLIDVVDYKHVQNGPGVILIADEADYGLDLAEDRPGLLYTRKRHMEGDLQARVKNTFRLALIATKHLHEDELLPNVDFLYNEVQITLLDRLNFPNTAETFASVRDDLTALLRDIYGEVDVQLAVAYDDPREPFTVKVTVGVDVDVDTLIARLNEKQAVAS